MPPQTGKRRGRKEANDGDRNLPDSSPSRPAKRTKRASKIADAESSQSKPEHPKELHEEIETAAGLDMNETADRVAAILEMPNHLVQVSRDHGNHKLGTDTQAYAKIAGKDWTYYVRSLRAQIGRAPDPVHSANINDDASRDEERLPAAEAEPSRIHIDLGPDKLISRQQAEIFFDSEGEGDGCWWIIVNGRNPIKVDDTPVHRGQKMQLRCGRVIEIGRVQMLFILPKQEIIIGKRWLRKAGLMAPESEDDPPVEDRTPEPTVPGRAYPAGAGGPSYPTPIAPAPPDYQRARTPIQRKGGFYSTTPGGASYSTGTMMITTTDQLDLSLDENKLIKPTFSYSQLISQAILDTEQKCTTLNKIYEHIMKNYAYYRNPEKQSNWQNSIRHNLSLSKCFGKIPRSFNEPGKGMKWTILPDYLEEMSQSCRRTGRGGHRGPSVPGSPAVGSASKHNQVVDATTRESPSSTERLKRSPRSPPLNSYPLNVQHTPDQRMNQPPPSHAHEALPGDGSPLPRHRRQNGSTYGLSDNVQGSPPSLSSSYLPEEGGSFITPAPHRVHPRLVPPSTAQRPSQHMPTSSPAPFWKLYDSHDQTPMRTPFGGLGVETSSPIKGAGGGERPLQSSSPPASRVGETGSPTRPQNPSSSLGVKREAVEIEEEEEEEAGGIDLAKGFQSISTFHSQANNGVVVNGRS